MLQKNNTSIKDVFVYSTDDYIEQKATELQQTYTAVFEHYIHEATDHMNNLLKQAIANNYSVVFDHTNLSIKKRKWILEQFPSSYKKVCLCFVPPRDTAEQRMLEARILSRPGKRIPDYTISYMLKTYEKPTLEEGFDDVSYYSISNKLLNKERK